MEIFIISVYNTLNMINSISGIAFKLLLVLGIQLVILISMQQVYSAELSQNTKVGVADSQNTNPINIVENNREGVSTIYFWIEVVIGILGSISVLAAILTILLGWKVHQINTAKNEITEALAEFKTVSEINKLESEIRVFAHRQLWDGIGKRAVKLIQVAPKHYAGYMVYSQFLGMHKGDYENAVKNLVIADELIGRDNAQIKYNLACFYSCINEQENAIFCLKECILLDKQYAFSRLEIYDHELDNIRNTDDFQEILRILGLTP